MKKALALILTFVLCLTLCACGGNGTNNEPSTTNTIQSAIEETTPPENNELAYLTKEPWKNIFSGKTTIKFSPDGTGKYSKYDMTWEFYDKTLTLYYTYDSAYGSQDANIEYSIMEYNGTKMLSSASSIYVSAANFKEGCAAAKEYMISIAEELDWGAAHDLYLSNGAKAELEYDGKIVKWTAKVNEIADSYCYMANETYNGYPLNSITVYMETDELAKLNKYQMITVIGKLNIGSFTSINCGFVVEQ